MLIGLCKDTCDDQRVGRPATGKTPLRNVRSGDDIWLPVLAKALAEATTATDVVNAGLREYISTPPDLTFSEWPEAPQWLEGNCPGWRKTAAAVRDVTADLADEEYLGVALWLAVTRHRPADQAPQRLVAGFLLLRANLVTEGGWRDRYPDSDALLRAINAVLSEHPLPQPARG